LQQEHERLDRLQLLFIFSGHKQNGPRTPVTDFTRRSGAGTQCFQQTLRRRRSLVLPQDDNPAVERH